MAVQKRKTISLSIPMKIYDMLNELAQLTFSTKTKIVVDAVRREYRMYKMNIGNIEEENNVSKDT